MLWVTLLLSSFNDRLREQGNVYTIDITKTL